MQKLERVFQNVAQNGKRIRLSIHIVAVERRLGKLDIPVAEVIPNKIHRNIACNAELVSIQVRRHLADTALELRDNPLIRRRKLHVFNGLNLHPFYVHQHETGSVPKLVDEVSTRFHLRIHITGVVARSNARKERKTQGVRAVFFDNFERIDTVAERLTHLSALLVAHYTVN